MTGVPRSQDSPLGAPSSLVLALIAGILVAIGLGQIPPIVARDVEQLRGNAAAAGRTLAQRFVPLHDGLSALEITAEAGTGSGDLRLRIDTLDGATRAVAVVKDVVPGSQVRFAFTPIAGSAGQEFVAVIEPVGDGQVAARMWTRDGYRPGALLVDGAAQPGDLRFQTDYTLTLTGALALLGRGTLGAAAPLAALWAVLFAPGLCLLELFGNDDRGWLRVTAALGLSLAFWPVAWLWAPFQWTTVTLAVAVVPLGLAALVLEARRIFRAGSLRIDVLDLLLVVVLLLTCGTRALAVRDVALPLWVDSSRHALITQLFMIDGHVPVDYRPLLDVPRFFYHFGFHSLAATYALLAGQPVDRAMLLTGQALNALTALGGYALATYVTRSRRAGLVAAFVVGLVAVYPAYFVTWGRYTQLAGLVLLVPAMIATARVLAWDDTAPGRAGVLAAGCLVAGLLLTHYRVFIFWLVWLAVVTCAALLRAWRAGGRRAAGRTLRPAVIAMVLTLLLAAPWIVQIARDTLPAVNARSLLSSPEGYNAFPNDYLDRGIERWWLVSGFVAVVLAVLTGGRRLAARHWRALAVGAWAGSVVVVLNLDRLGGPSTWMVNNQSWVISTFVPASALLGWAAGALFDFDLRSLAPRNPRWRGVAPWLQFTLAWAALAFAGYVGVLGAWQAIDIVNPATVLATQDDRAALQWAAEHTAPDGVFLVSGRYWQTNTWMAPGGAAWLAPLALRQATLMPIDYGYDIALRDRVNALNRRLADAPDLSAPDLRAELAALGVRYAYVDARETHVTADMLLADPAWRVAYTNGGAWIFEWVSRP